MFCAALAGLPLPLLPMQILWMNLVTDGLPAIALGLDRPATDCMTRPPGRRGESIFSGGMHVKIVARGIIIAGLHAVRVRVFTVRRRYRSHARTLAFTTLVVLQLIYVFQCRTAGVVGSRGAPPNYYLFAAVAASFVMQLVVLYVPPLQTVFGVVPLAATTGC